MSDIWFVYATLKSKNYVGFSGHCMHRLAAWSILTDKTQSRANENHALDDVSCDSRDFPGALHETLLLQIVHYRHDTLFAADFKSS